MGGKHGPPAFLGRGGTPSSANRSTVGRAQGPCRTGAPLARHAAAKKSPQAAGRRPSRPSPTTTCSRGVASGANGILSGLSEGKIWVDMSTVSPKKAKSPNGRGSVYTDSERRMLDRARCRGSVPQVQTGTADDHGRRRTSRHMHVVNRSLRESSGAPNAHSAEENGPGDWCSRLAINISLAVAEWLAFGRRPRPSPAPAPASIQKLAIDVMTASPIGLADC